MSGYLYVFQEKGEDYYKLGISKNFPDLRKNQLQTGNPRPLIKVRYYKIKNYRNVETRVKRKLQRFRTDGGTEWYRCNKQVVLNAIEEEITGRNDMRAAAYVWFFIQVLFVLFMVYMIVDVLWLNGTTLSFILDLMY